MRAFTCIAAALLVAGAVHARTYDVGPAMPYSAVSEVAADGHRNPVEMFPPEKRRSFSSTGMCRRGGSRELGI